MANMQRLFVEGGTDVGLIDSESRNKFKWEWLCLKDKNDEFFSNFFRKLFKDGVAWCCYCKCEIKYGSGGVRCLKDHANKSKQHELKRRVIRSNQSIPAAMQATSSKIAGIENRSSASLTQLPYGAPPNVVEYLDLGLGSTTTTCTSTSDQIRLEVSSVPKPVSLKDRVSHQESLICSFIAEHSLSLTMAPRLIELAQELSKDSAALKNLHMERQTATYKLRHGLSALEHVRLISVLKNKPFSLNVDECTAKGSKKRILNVLVCYFCEQRGKCVCDLYASLEMSIVNSETVFSSVIEKFREDEIPLTNLVSVLSDSAAYMRGSLNGFHARLKAVAPHIVDIDGDVCHHMHNAVKKFVFNLDEKGLLPKLLDDLFNDFDYSADLRDDLKEICGHLDIAEQVPIQRASHRWMSIFDAAVRFMDLQKALTLFYSSWLSVEEKKVHQSTLNQLLKNTKKDSRLKIIAILQRLRCKNLTPAGRERKRRIAVKLFHHQHEILLLANFFVSILPLFKSFILTFEQKEPMIHRLFDEIVRVYKTFLTCFLTHEYVNTFADISKINTSSDNVLPLKRIFVGEAAESILGQLEEQDAKIFRRNVLKAYREVSEYLKHKLPIRNKNLTLLSTIDPELCGHSRASTGLQDLFDVFPTIIKREQKDEFTRAASSLQTDAEFRSSISEKKLDLWWAKVLRNRSYAILSPVVTACLSIFTGPRVESSFSVMNNIITSTTNKMDVQTYEAIHKIKYKLLNHEKSSVQLFHRQDPVYTPVDAPLCYYMQTAARRMKNVSQHKVRTGTRKKIKKLSIHQKAEAVRSSIELNATTSETNELQATGSKRKIMTAEESLCPPKQHCKGVKKD